MTNVIPSVQVRKNSVAIHGAKHEINCDVVVGIRTCSRLLSIKVSVPQTLLDTKGSQ